MSLGDSVAAHWQPFEIPDAGIRFLSEGNAILSTVDLVVALRAFVTAVILRLEDQGVTGTTLQEQWAAIESADSDERAFLPSGRTFGRRSYAINEPLDNAILDAASITRRVA